MTNPRRPRVARNCAPADLADWDSTLANFLPALVLSRDWEALIRWCKVRSWIDNALAGEESQELEVIALALAYLAERVADARGHAGWPIRPGQRPE